MVISIILFVTWIFGLNLNRRHLILILISIELILLAVMLLILIVSYIFDDITEQIYSIIIIAVTGAKSAIGL